MKNFEELELSPVLSKSLARMNYSVPTPIQAKAIPPALEGHDIIGTAQTGTGKTAAYAIPLIEKLLATPKGSALVLTPTRELGKQVMDIARQLLGHGNKINTAFIIGGEPMDRQFKQLRARPRLIIGTPGRINDHLQRGSMKLHDTNFLVLDETDRMLDLGFTEQLEKIFKYLPSQHQTLMFSATFPPNILKLSEKYLNEPVRIAIGKPNIVAQNIKQDVLRIEQDQKYKELKLQLHDRNGTVIVFVKTKHGADRIATNLRRDGFTSEALHGDLRQRKRDRVMLNFRKQNFRILIATDIAARGLDVPHIEHVINYDLPQVAEDFIHRIGRTARAGAQGCAISFVSRQDGRKWSAIERLLNPKPANDKGNKDNRDSRDNRDNKNRNNKKSASAAGKNRNFKKKNFKNKNLKNGGSKKANKPQNTSEPQNANKPQNMKKHVRRERKKAA